MSRGDRYKGSAEIDYEHSWACNDTYTFDGDPVHDPNEECTPTPVIGLGHQCDSWIIGTRAEVQKLITDLTKLLEKLP